MEEIVLGGGDAQLVEALQDLRREDGFCVAFATDERRFARAQVLKLARAYRQAAIYQFSYKDGVLREVVWCDPNKQEQAAEAPERMAPLRMPPQSELAVRDFVDL